MPAAFDKCEKDGGKIRTISHGKKYFHVCSPKGGGPSIRGEMKTKQSLSSARDGESKKA